MIGRFFALLPRFATIAGLIGAGFWLGVDFERHVRLEQTFERARWDVRADTVRGLEIPHRGWPSCGPDRWPEDADLIEISIGARFEAAPALLRQREQSRHPLQNPVDELNRVSRLFDRYGRRLPEPEALGQAVSALPPFERASVARRALERSFCAYQFDVLAQLEALRVAALTDGDPGHDRALREMMTALRARLEPGSPSLEAAMPIEAAVAYSRTLEDRILSEAESAGVAGTR